MNMRIRFIYLFIVFSIIPLPPSLYAESAVKVFKLATVAPENSLNFKIINALLKEAFQRNNISIIIVSWPGKRALHEANVGRIDGDALRIYGMSKQYSNLVKIPEPVRRLDMCAYVTNADFKVDGWSSLTPYMIITKSGIKIVEKQLKGLIPPNHIYEVQTYEAAFNMLTKRHGNVLIASPSDADSILKKEEFQNKGIRMLTPPVHSMEMFTYLHKKHEDLVLKIAASLKQMKTDGTYEKIMGQENPTDNN